MGQLGFGFWGFGPWKEGCKYEVQYEYMRMVTNFLVVPRWKMQKTMASHTIEITPKDPRTGGEYCTDTNKFHDFM